MSAKSLSVAKPYRWVETQHDDLDFYHVPRPFPWPRTAEFNVDADKDFPFRTLLDGIVLLLADEDDPPLPIWRRLAEVIEAGEDLGGAFEAAICALASQRRWLPPTVNLTLPDPACDLAYLAGEGQPADPEYLLSNSFGFGGINAALVFRRHDGR